MIFSFELHFPLENSYYGFLEMYKISILSTFKNDFSQFRLNLPM